jgi:hypothetical protein
MEGGWRPFISEISRQSTNGGNPHIYVYALFIARMLLVEPVMLYCFGVDNVRCWEGLVLGTSSQCLFYGNPYANMKSQHSFQG